jgi:glycosyltransferase involved in cell wall biosynthesis
MSLVSIITPAYNAAEFISETCKMVQRQSYVEWELVVVDDCSSDNTAEIIKELSNTDLRIKLFSLEQNSGPAVARNRAIEKANGRYIAFLDCDDRWDPTKLEKQVAFMQAKEYYFTYHRHQKTTPKGDVLKQFKPPEILTYQKALRYNPLHTSSVIYDAEKLGKVYMPLIRKRQDYGLWFRLLKKTDGHLLDEMLSDYVQMPGSVSSRKIGLVKYNWELYRRHEKMSLIKATYCMTWCVFSKLSGIK